MLRTLEPQKEAENKNAEADFKNQCSYKMKSVYVKKSVHTSHYFFGSFEPSICWRNKKGWLKLIIFYTNPPFLKIWAFRRVCRFRASTHSTAVSYFTRLISRRHRPRDWLMRIKHALSRCRILVSRVNSVLADGQNECMRL